MLSLPEKSKKRTVYAGSLRLFARVYPCLLIEFFLIPPLINRAELEELVAPGCQRVLRKCSDGVDGQILYE